MNKNIQKDSPIFIGIKNDNITQMGSLINHSYNPNGIIKKSKKGLYIIHAKKDINKGEELTMNYSENSPWYIDPPNSTWK